MLQNNNYITISNIVIVCVCVQSLSCVQLLVTPWTTVYQASLSMEFFRQEDWNGLPFLPPGDLANPEIKPEFPASPALAGRSFTTVPPGKSKSKITIGLFTISK